MLAQSESAIVARKNSRGKKPIADPDSRGSLGRKGGRNPEREKGKRERETDKIEASVVGRPE